MTLSDITRDMPKVLLHEHLDGGLRIGTLFELLQRAGLPAPDSEAELARLYDTRAHAGSLPEYLSGFTQTVAAMASLEALERVAFEAAEDARLEGCVIGEFRAAPSLFESHGIRSEAATEAMLSGLAKSALPSGLIVCGMRHDPVERVAASAELALRYRSEGVVGFDLAGPEAGFPATRHAVALQRVRDEGLPITLHAGEADGAHRVIEAVRLGARRIGHGIHLADLLGTRDGAILIAEVLDRKVHLEICLSSNVHTGAVESTSAHPIRKLWEAGVALSFHTDNRLISRVSHSDEALTLITDCGFELHDLHRMTRLATDASFLPAAARLHAHRALAEWSAAGVRAELS